MVKVGLDTLPGFAPTPRAIPRTNAVFPAPSSPYNRTTAPASRVRANASPAALVAASLPVTRPVHASNAVPPAWILRLAFDALARGQPEDGVPPALGDVAGQPRDVRFVGLRQIARRAVQIGGKLAGSLRIQDLREPGGNHPREQIASAAGGHARVAGEVDERAP